MDTIKNRYDFVFYFDVKDGNPNGDPDAGNLPRIDPETGNGIVTDVCLKRKVRNYVLMTYKGEKPYDIFIKEKAVLNVVIQEAHKEVEKSKSGDKNNSDKTEAARQWMSKNYYDIRTFGAVLTTGENAGQVRGPVQLTFGRSVEPIVALEHTITRVAKTTEERAEAGGSEMGRKYTVPYGLYRSHGFVSPFLAAQTGFCEKDLELFWNAMREMFEHDRSAARGLMSSRRLIAFEHKTALGSKPAHELFNRVTHRRTTDGPAREFSDYQILLDGSPVDEIFKIVQVE